MISTLIEEPVLEIEGLEQRLTDPERGEEFLVRVPQKLVVPRRGVIALLGPSGCGKTTLLTVLGLLRAPSHPNSLKSFCIWTRNSEGKMEKHDLKKLWIDRNHSQIEHLRRKYIGFALQSGELLPSLTVSENIRAPMHLNGFSKKLCNSRVQELIYSFGLSTNGEIKSGKFTRLENSRINKLSGGEYQRVVLARAIAHKPTLVFVDEPTSALNRDLAWEALNQLRNMQSSHESHGATIMITHDEQLADAFATTIVRMAPVKGMAAGEVVEITQTHQPLKTIDFELPS